MRFRSVGRAAAFSSCYPNQTKPNQTKKSFIGCSVCVAFPCLPLLTEPLFTVSALHHCCPTAVFFSNNPASLLSFNCEILIFLPSRSGTSQRVGVLSDIDGLNEHPSMPLLEIAIAQPNFQNQTKLLFTAFAFGNDLGLRKSLNLHANRRFETGRARLVVKAVATIEHKTLALNKDGHLSHDTIGSNSTSSAMEVDSSDEELNESERRRRMRISKANKGNTPWNKGRKHSPETLQRIKERTRLAMQTPKVKMKLVNKGHAQSAETKVKIGIGVRIGWQRRRDRLLLQESCHFEWQNLIAEASRNGSMDEEELQWDSYDVQNEQLEQEWLRGVEERKATQKQKGNKRAPKSPEQKRKIAEAIAAKWADPTYRDRVVTGIAKFHGVPAEGERKPRRRPTSSTATKPRSSYMRKARDADPKPKIDPIQKMKLKSSKTPLFKDPLASSKLEMIKNIRAQRAAAEANGIEAIKRARLLIAEAEKAAQALEIAAATSLIARASLMETRKMISEAIQFIEAIGLEPESFNDSSVDLANPEGKIINGGPVLAVEETSKFGIAPFDLESPIMKEVLSVKSEKNPHPNGTKADVLAVEDDLGSKEAAVSKKWDVLGVGDDLGSKESALTKSAEDDLGSKEAAVTKKWVRGRLVEVTDG